MYKILLILIFYQTFIIRYKYKEFHEIIYCNENIYYDFGYFIKINIQNIKYKCNGLIFNNIFKDYLNNELLKNIFNKNLNIKDIKYFSIQDRNNVNMLTDNFNNNLFKILDIKKNISKNGGLHRILTYDFNFKIDKNHLNNSSQCKFYIGDYTTNYFYIDEEEIDKSKIILVNTNNIENPNFISNNYLYFLKIDIKDFNNEGNFLNYNSELKLKFHIRYGESNSTGQELLYLNRDLKIFSNCFNQGPTNSKNIFFNYLFKNEKIENYYYKHYEINMDINSYKVINYVGNSNNEKLTWVTTLGLTTIVMIYILYLIK